MALLGIRLVGAVTLGFLVSWWFKVLDQDRPSHWEEWTLEFHERRRDSGQDVFRYDPEGGFKEKEFSPDQAYHHLLRLGSSIHSYATDEIDLVERYLVSYVETIQREARDRGVVVEVDFDRRTQILAYENINKLSKRPVKVPVYFEASNLIVRVVGRKDEALLVSAHHDSQSSSYGASDDGVSVAIALELLREASREVPRNTLVVLLDSAEEKGLMGSRSFVKHAWYDSVKAVVNLEASGVGGRALLFQANSDKVLGAFARAPHPFGSSIGNDAFRQGVINSRTDFEVYRATNRTGIDMALCANRAFYHTSKDNVEQVYWSSLSRFGETVMVAVQDLLRSPSLEGAPLVGGIFFDVLGYKMLVLTQANAIRLTTITLMFLLVGLVLGRRVPVGGLLAILGGIASYGVVSFLIVMSLADMHLHSRAFEMHLVNALLGLCCIGGSISSFARPEGPARMDRVMAQSMALFWIPVQMANLALLRKGFSSLYPTLTLTISHLLVLMMDWVGYFPKARLGICFIACTLMHDAGVTLILSLSQGIPTGSPKAGTHLMVCAISLLPVIATIPTIPSSLYRSYRLLVAMLLVWATASLVIFSTFPLTAQAPMAIHFEQHSCSTPSLGCLGIRRDGSPNLPANVSFVRAIAPSYLESALSHLPSAAAHPLTSTTPYYHMKQKFYSGKPPALPPNPITLNVPPSPSPKGKYGFILELDGHHSRICGLHFHNMPLAHLTVQTSANKISLLPNTSSPQSQFMLMRRSTRSPFRIHAIPRSIPTTPIRISAWCGYDDVEQHIPEVKEIWLHLPPWAVLSTSHVTLLSVHADFLIQP